MLFHVLIFQLLKKARKRAVIRGKRVDGERENAGVGFLMLYYSAHINDSLYIPHLIMSQPLFMSPYCANDSFNVPRI